MIISSHGFSGSKRGLYAAIPLRTAISAQILYCISAFCARHDDSAQWSAQWSAQARTRERGKRGHRRP
eukprot:4931829-Prymnesium_polylepis.1